MDRIAGRFFAIAFAATCCVLAATPCFAQFGGGAGQATGFGAAANRQIRGAQQNQSQTKEPAPPPVLPGTKAPTEAAAPSGSTADLTPTDALFDAINRGDMPAAREAINRGANLDGRNLLGLTPLDLSVDLGRNDISFMLLSQRGEDPTARQSARSGVSASGTAHGDANGVASAAPARRAAARTRVTDVAAREPADDSDPPAPRLYSGNGGTPIPAAGFLGFDGGRSAR